MTIPRTYIKSSRSGGSGGNCVEWSHSTGYVYVRDSKDRTGPELVITPAQWHTLVTAVITGHPHEWITRTTKGVQLHHRGVALAFTRAEWHAFREGARAGECIPTKV